MKLRTLCLILFGFAVIALADEVSAQQPGLSSNGRDFYLAYVAPSIKCGAIKPFQSVMAVIASYYDCNVTLNYFDPMQGGKEIQGTMYHIAAKNAQLAPFDLTYMYPKDASGNPINPDGEVPMYSACHIHSDRPVTVHYYSTGPNSGAMYLVLPTQVLGNEYVVASFQANPALGAAASRHFACTIDSASSEFAIIAVKDNTKVTITPNSTTTHLHKLGVSNGNSTWGPTDGTPHPYSVTLSRGQVYWVKSDIGDEQYDMSNSLVHADQPVAVIGANEGAFNGVTQYASSGGDQRNMMVQQLVPSIYLRSTDYLSMPFMDSPGLPVGDASSGDQFRVFTPDSSSVIVDLTLDNSGGSSQSVQPYQAMTVDNIITGANFSARNGQPIMVEQYDYRAMTTGEPITAPTMMNVVALQNYGKTFCIGVPDDRYQLFKKRYINVIARKDQLTHIKVQHNGGAAIPLTALPVAGQTATIPHHPELQGERFEIQPGGYYITGDSAFMVYSYGMLGLDPDYDLGDNDDDDYYFEYATPVGQTFGVEGASSPHISADTICNGWHVYLRDANPLDRGIAQVEILKDPLGVQLRKPNSDSGYMSVNCSFNPVNFTVVPGDTGVDFFIQVDNPLVDADAYVWALNVAGNDTLMYLHYTAPKLSFKPDSAAFYSVPLATDTCTQFVFKNLGKSGSPAVNVLGYHWKQGGQGVRMASESHPFPFKLMPGDSITFRVCFNATTPGRVYLDTLVIETDCPTPSAPIVGSTTVAVINTEDHDFGAVLIGQTSCYPIKVWNSGKAPFTLTKRWVLNNFNNYEFSFSDTSVLPVTIPPGGSVHLKFCYTPDLVESDSAIQHWASDIPEPFTHVKKDFSLLWGRGLKPLDFVQIDKRSNEVIRILLNPADRDRIIVELPTDGGGHVEAFDILGRAVLRQQIGAGETPLNIAGLPSGTYILRVSNEKTSRITIFSK